MPPGQQTIKQSNINRLQTSNFIVLNQHLYECCLEYINRRKLTEQTKLLYCSELKNIFKNEILTQEIYSKIYSKGNYYKSVLKLIINTCEHFEIPYHHYKVIRPKIKSKRIPQIWQEKDILKIASSIEDYGLLIECAYYIGAGLRFSSTILLKWDDFLWEDWLKDTNHTGKCKVFAKGDKEKILQVDPKLMKKLHNHARDKNKLFQNIPYKNYSGNIYIFINQSELDDEENKLKKQQFDNILDSKKEEIDIKKRARISIIKQYHNLVNYKLNKISNLFNNTKIKFHSIRSTRATNLLKKGFKLLTIKEQLMHESISSTEIYLNLENIDIENEFNEKL